MNRISIVRKSSDPRLAVVIDDRPLAEHFMGRRGSHPSQVFVLGWDVEATHAERVVERLLFDASEYDGALAGFSSGGLTA
jgi:hypothetical protein